MYDPFDLDDELPSEHNKSPLKQRQQQFSDKFTKTMTKNFLHDSFSKQEQYIEERQMQKSNSINNETIREKRRNLRANSKILQPLKNPQRIQITQQKYHGNQLNIISIEDDEDIEEVPSSPMRRESRSPQPLINKPEREDNILELNQVEMPDRKQANILFYEQQQSSEIKPDQTEFNLPIHNQLAHHLEEIEIDSANTVLDHVNVRHHSQYFNIHNKELMRKLIYNHVKPLHTLKMILSRDNSGFNTFWPEFYFKFSGEEQIIISGKRTTARPISTFILSMSNKDFQESSQNYLGKLKSNALGDVLYVYGSGSNPTNAKQKNLLQRQMIATIRYQSNFFNTGKPRQFEVFTLQEGVNYFSLKGVKMYGSEPGLDELFNHEVNRDRIRIYSNKKPMWNEQLGGFMLNFRGRVPCPSIKNFILEDNFGNEAMVFGRKEDNQFVLEIADKISPYLAVAVALSAFDSKIMCQ